MENTKQLLELELKKQKTINFLIGEIIKYSTNLEALDESMEKTVDMLMGILGLSYIKICLNENINNKSYSRSISDPTMITLNNQENIYSHGEQYKVSVNENESSLSVPLINHKNNEQIGMIFAKSNNHEFFDSSILSFFEILAIQIPIIVANALVFEKMKHDSKKDILTNCYNRTHLKKTLERIEKENISASLAFFDLDNFKFINDTFGHSIGDQILFDVSEIAISYSEKYNADVFRYGGDEFVIIFFEYSLEKVRELLDKFRVEIMDRMQTNIDLDINQTISIGLANYPETVNNIGELLEAADRALIRGKSKQKNRVYLDKI